MKRRAKFSLGVLFMYLSILFILCVMMSRPHWARGIYGNYDLLGAAFYFICGSACFVTWIMFFLSAMREGIKSTDVSNEAHRSLGIYFVAAGVSALYVASLWSIVYKNGADAPIGFTMWIFGGFSLLSLQPTWLANPLLQIASLSYFFGDFKFALALSSVAAGLAAQFYLSPIMYTASMIEQPRAPNAAHFHFASGFWLWFASIFLQAAAACWQVVTDSHKIKTGVAPERQLSKKK